MHDRSQVAELGEANHRAVEPPHLRVRLAEAERIEALPLPARCPGELRKASRPRLVELDEKLCADVSRHVGEPRQFGAERGQFVDLVESRGVAFVAAAARKTNAPLLQAQVPEKAEGVVPCSKAHNLLGRRVDAIAERLVDEHGVKHSFVCSGRKRLSHGPSRRLLAQGRLSPQASGGSAARRGMQTVGTALLVAVLLRGLVWRCAARDHQAVRRCPEGLLPALKDGVSALKNR